MQCSGGTLAGGTGPGEWPPRESARRAVEVSQAKLQTGENVGEGHAAGVVEVHAPALYRREIFEGGHHLLHVFGGGDADRIAQHDLFDAHLKKLLCHLAHLLWADGSLVGTTKGHGNVRPYMSLCRLRAIDDCPGILERLSNAAIDIGAAKALGRRDEQGYVFELGLERPGETARIGDEGHVARPRALVDSPQNVFG